MPDKEPGVIQLIQGKTYRYTAVELRTHPLTSKKDGIFLRSDVVYIKKQGITIGIYLGTAAQVMRDMKLQVTFLDARVCLIFKPTEEFLRQAGIHFDPEYVFIPLGFETIPNLEQVGQ